MKDYKDCIEYLHSLGFSMEVCKKICSKYERERDMEGLVDYVLLCEAMVDSCVE